MEKVKEQKHTKTFRGTVVSDAMQDTIVVRVNRYVKHARTGKYIRKAKKYAVHSPSSEHKVGDAVVFEECRPISKTKSFRIVS